jgi:isoamylase
LISTLILSQGVPMILAGDELGHTQNGNNNAYCQDNEISWLNWDLAEDKQVFLRFVKTLLQLRHDEPVLNRRSFFLGRAIRGANITDVNWFRPDGKDMTDEDWGGNVRSLGMRLAGDQIGETDERGAKIVGDTLLILLNAHWEPMPFTLPPTNPGQEWKLVFDTADDALGPAQWEQNQYQLRDRSLAVFRTRVVEAAAEVAK